MIYEHFKPFHDLYLILIVTLDIGTGDRKLCKVSNNLRNSVTWNCGDEIFYIGRHEVIHSVDYSSTLSHGNT